MENKNNKELLEIQNINLPIKIEDVSKFVLVGRERLIAIRAEIRAIDKVGIARDVRDQKKEEALMLSEALLDAEVRLGDLLKEIPTAQGVRTDKIQLADSTVAKFEKPKKEVIQGLGFSQKQAERFETLANNRDLVEKVKQEARENDDIPTRSRVIDLAQQRKKREQEEQQKEDDCYKYIRDSKKEFLKFHDMIYALAMLDIDEEKFKMWQECLNDSNLADYLKHTNNGIPKLIKIQNFLKGVANNEKRNT